jgi:hypothetical protein
MAGLKQWSVVIALGGTLIVGMTNCVVAPAPVPSGYVVSPPVVVIRPDYPHRYYYPYRYSRPYRPYDGWYPRHRW